MKEITLKIVTKKTIDFPMTQEQRRDFPTDECKQIVLEESRITVEYKPSRPSWFDEERFIELVKSIYKRKLNAHSVEVVERD